MAMRSEIKTDDPYKFVQVLWVDWKGSIAYRCGTGRIWAKVWERQNEEKLTLSSDEYQVFATLYGLLINSCFVLRNACWEK
ncbi:uncharacterized protein BDZ99DRAFT_465085 [Mytilinidion resinicola]|uniref:Uncharacterized protein n=1 Tax=Mytilinidion resinicola TaxID=574789 RepID=A0A6A6YGL9_9PEZI|nr:uncharacterized protein BDZ99DRAFT_465085 [Mytilinidion resinicola]KAF2807154.1 hypothetical protein BDZ99DRAFT_465085 [Mytilinidion resinicola]